MLKPSVEDLHLILVEQRIKRINHKDIHAHQKLLISGIILMDEWRCKLAIIYL